MPVKFGWDKLKRLLRDKVQNGAVIYAADAGSSDTYAITLDPIPTAYTTGMVVNFKANTANTGAATLNCNGLGAKTIKKLHDQDLATGDIESGQIVTVAYDGTNFQMQSQAAGSIDLSAPGAIGGTTAGTIRFLIDEDTEAASDTLTANQCSGGLIDNIGQGAADCNYTLPTIAAGYNFVVIAGEPSANYLRITAPAAGTMVVDGVLNKTYASLAAPAKGNFMTVFSALTAPGADGILTGAALAIGTTKSSVANGAFNFYINGVKYAKGATAAGTAPNAVTTAQNKYGCQAFDIGADGTIDAISCTNIAAGLNSAVLAYEDLPAVAASHVRIGYVTAMSTDAGGFIWATTLFDDAAVTEAYTSTAAYTPALNWIVTTGAGTVTSG